MYKIHIRYNLILYERDMKTCLHALAVGLITIIGELLHEVDASVEPGTPES